jgi:hypothetical protein
MIVELEPKEAEERLKVPLELGIESKLEGASRPMVRSSPLAGNGRD